LRKNVAKLPLLLPAFWLLAIHASADVTLTTMVAFDGTNGLYPAAGFIEGRDGNFYFGTGGGTLPRLFEIPSNGVFFSPVFTRLCPEFWNEKGVSQ
jgi:hypothetical protein